jgi:hypothetical protein
VGKRKWLVRGRERGYRAVIYAANKVGGNLHNTRPMLKMRIGLRAVNSYNNAA